MNWLIKVAAFKVLGALPSGASLYRLLQEKATKSLTVTDASVQDKLDVGFRYLRKLSLSFDDLEDVRPWLHVDIGAGSMPTVPLVFYSAGFEHQLLCDIQPNLEIERVAQVVQRFRRLAAATEPLPSPWQRLPPPVGRGECLRDYLDRLGIEYIAPYHFSDIADRPGPKVVTCTQVLLYLRRDAIRQLLETISDALVEGGLFLADAHLYDIYSEVDRSLSPYNKWRYSDFVWEKLINCRMMYFNRLTPTDYRELLDKSGLELIEFELTEPTEDDLARFRQTRIQPKFKHVPERELAARTLHVVARRRATA